MILRTQALDLIREGAKFMEYLGWVLEQGADTSFGFGFQEGGRGGGDIIFILYFQLLKKGEYSLLWFLKRLKRGARTFNKEKRGKECSASYHII